MKTAPRLLSTTLAAALAILPALAAEAPLPPAAAPDPAAAPTGDDATPAVALEPFVATYDAWNGGKPAGTASMRLAREGRLWRVDLDVTGNRGLARWVRLDIDQGTVFDEAGGDYRPLRQDTRRKALFMGRHVEGVYDWNTGIAQWSGDIKDARRQPVPLREGDKSGLLINLAIVRDAAPGRSLRYRFVDGGQVHRGVVVRSGQQQLLGHGGIGHEAGRRRAFEPGAEQGGVDRGHGAPGGGAGRIQGHVQGGGPGQARGQQRSGRRLRLRRAVRGQFHGVDAHGVAGHHQNAVHGPGAGGGGVARPQAPPRQHAAVVVHVQQGGRRRRVGREEQDALAHSSCVHRRATRRTGPWESLSSSALSTTSAPSYSTSVRSEK